MGLASGPHGELSLCGTRWARHELSRPRKERKSKKRAREPSLELRRRYGAHQCSHSGLVALRRKVSRRSRPLCFAVLLRRMTVFTTCWKRRKKANAARWRWALRLSRENTRRARVVPHSLLPPPNSVSLFAPSVLSLSHIPPLDPPSFCGLVTPDALLNPRQKVRHTTTESRMGP